MNMIMYLKLIIFLLQLTLDSFSRRNRVTNGLIFFKFVWLIIFHNQSYAGNINSKITWLFLENTATDSELMLRLKVK